MERNGGAKRKHGLPSAGDLAWPPRRVALVYLPLLASLLLLAASAALWPYFPGEVELMRAVQAVDWPAVGAVLLAVSALGAAPLSVALAAGVCCALALRRRWTEVAVLVFGFAGDAACRLVKEVVGRARPDPEMVYVHTLHADPGFPSGHVVNFVTFCGFLAYLVWRFRRPSPGRGAALLLLLAPIGLVGVSRVYLGAHYPSDVAGGYLLGGLWLAWMIELHRWLRRRAAAASRRDATPEG